MAEVERLADHLVLMEAGRVLAVGRARRPAERPGPAARRCARRRGQPRGDGRGFDPTYGLLSVEVAGGAFLVPSPRLPPGGHSAAPRPGPRRQHDHDPAASTILNVTPARILAVSAAGDHEIVVVLGLGADGAGARLLARVTRKSWDRLALAVGREVHAQVKAVALARAPDGLEP